ncbi:hypothetical protein [Brevundimonas sp. R86498]|uniref:hypothetical protein n=1 Tax=Brevundimonas sp. R86498 TaxID=3093845 RepID=UPI0037C54657
MLSMLLLLATAPQTVVPAMPPRPMPPVQTQPEATMRVLGGTPPCPSNVVLATDPTTPGGGLMWRGGGEAVGLYRLLDRYVDGCPAPIIVNYRVPGSNALGQEAGREPVPVSTPPR